MHEQVYWEQILEQKGAIPEEASLDELTQELLVYLKDTDPQKRDRFGYQILSHWIISGQYDESQLQGFLVGWKADLQTGLGESGEDSVCTRSFAALMLSILVYRDIQAPYLSGEEFNNLLDEALAYFIAEQDLRGYDRDKGWLHATAHTADLLKFLARNPKTTQEQLERILGAISAKVMQQSGTFFTYGEDDRLALAVLDVLQRELMPEKALQAWVESFRPAGELGKVGIEVDQKAYSAYQNTRNFLRSLYFKISQKKVFPGAYSLDYDLYRVLGVF